MPGKIKSTAQQAFLAIHKPSVLHELSGGHIKKGLPYKVGNKRGGIGGGKTSGMYAKMGGK